MHYWKVFIHKYIILYFFNFFVFNRLCTKVMSSAICRVFPRRILKTFWDNKHFKCQTAKGKHSSDMRANWNPDSHCCPQPDLIVFIPIFFSGFWFLFAGRSVREEILWPFSGRDAFSLLSGEMLMFLSFLWAQIKVRLDAALKKKNCARIAPEVVPLWPINGMKSKRLSTNSPRA